MNNKSRQNKKMAFLKAISTLNTLKKETYVLEKTSSEKSKIDPIDNGSGMTNQNHKPYLIGSRI